MDIFIILNHFDENKDIAWINKDTPMIKYLFAYKQSIGLNSFTDKKPMTTQDVFTFKDMYAYGVNKNIEPGKTFLLMKSYDDLIYQIDHFGPRRIFKLIENG